MAQTCFKACAPGSLMIMGEYAVLTGYRALVAAIDKTLTVSITPRQDQWLSICSSLGGIRMHLDKLNAVKPFEYVLTALQSQPLNQGADIVIESQFSSQQGLGSSAAVTVALLAALYQWQKKAITRLGLYHHALQVVRTVQGAGSGADIIASIFGGMIAYCPKPLSIQALQPLLKLTVVFSGNKVTTTQALQNLTKNRLDSGLIKTLGELSEQAITALSNDDLTLFGNLMNRAQQTLQALELSTTAIEKIIQGLQQAGTKAAKISGSGLGDCVIGLDNQITLNNFNVLPIQLASQGLTID